MESTQSQTHLESQERLPISDRKWYYWCFLLAVMTVLAILNESEAGIHSRFLF